VFAENIVSVTEKEEEMGKRTKKGRRNKMDRDRKIGPREWFDIKKRQSRKGKIMTIRGTFKMDGKGIRGKKENDILVDMKGMEKRVKMARKIS
jgi:hypothetical protein